MSSRAIHRHFEALAAEALSHDGVNVSAVEYERCPNVVLPLRFLEEIAHAPQIAFAFLTHIADEQYSCFIPHPRGLERGRDCVQTHNSSAVVADARKKNLVLLRPTLDGCAGGKNRVDMRGQSNTFCF